MSDSAGTDIQDFCCPICLGIFLEPVVTPCKHTICRTCLDEHIKNTSLVCPVCRKRLGLWVRQKRMSAGTLVDTDLWERIQRKYPDLVKKRLEGDDAEPLQGPNCSHRRIAAPGELNAEFRQELEKVEAEKAAQKEREENESKTFIDSLLQSERASREATPFGADDHSDTDEETTELIQKLLKEDKVVQSSMAPPQKTSRASARSCSRGSNRESIDRKSLQDSNSGTPKPKVVKKKGHTTSNRATSSAASASSSKGKGEKVDDAERPPILLSQRWAIRARPGSRDSTALSNMPAGTSVSGPKSTRSKTSSSLRESSRLGSSLYLESEPANSNDPYMESEPANSNDPFLGVGPVWADASDDGEMSPVYSEVLCSEIRVSAVDAVIASQESTYHPFHNLQLSSAKNSPLPAGSRSAQSRSVRSERAKETDVASENQLPEKKSNSRSSSKGSVKKARPSKSNLASKNRPGPARPLRNVTLRVRESELSISEDSIGPELNHFKPIAPFPKTPPKRIYDSQYPIRVEAKRARKLDFEETSPISDTVGADVKYTIHAPVASLASSGPHSENQDPSFHHSMLYPFRRHADEGVIDVDTSLSAAVVTGSQPILEPEDTPFCSIVSSSQLTPRTHSPCSACRAENMASVTTPCECHGAGDAIVGLPPWSSGKGSTGGHMQSKTYANRRIRTASNQIDGARASAVGNGIPSKRKRSYIESNNSDNQTQVSDLCESSHGKGKGRTGTGDSCKKARSMSLGVSCSSSSNDRDVKKNDDRNCISKKKSRSKSHRSSSPIGQRSNGNTAESLSKEGRNSGDVSSREGRSSGDVSRSIRQHSISKKKSHSKSHLSPSPIGQRSNGNTAESPRKEGRSSGDVSSSIRKKSQTKSKDRVLETGGDGRTSQLESDEALALRLQKEYEFADKYKLNDRSIRLKGSAGEYMLRRKTSSTHVCDSC